MSRQPRTDLPGIPLHLVQRGNDRQACFLDDLDRRDYLPALHEYSRLHEVFVHAYVLMDNHVHLLVSSLNSGTTSRSMQGIGTTYVRHFNDRHERTGTLWEGRFQSCPVDTGKYLWNCHRYIELNPVRAGIVSTPDQFKWSSFSENAFGCPSGLVTPRPEFWALGQSEGECRAAYRGIFGAHLRSEELHEMRLHIRHERPLGGVDFVNRIEAITGLPAVIRPRGRPKCTPSAGQKCL